MVDFKRKRGESFETFLRRFNRTLIKSQKLKEVRKRRFTVVKRNKNKQKAYALRSKEMKEKTEYLKKIGKLKEEPRRRW